MPYKLRLKFGNNQSLDSASSNFSKNLTIIIRSIALIHNLGIFSSLESLSTNIMLSVVFIAARLAIFWQAYKVLFDRDHLMC